MSRLNHAPQRGRTRDDAIARVIGLDPLPKDAPGLRVFGWDGETPLWYYVLKESEIQAGGERLGDVGGRIVAEVLLGLLAGVA